MRQLNKNIEEDNLWKDRFVFRQIDAQFQRFEDGSGGILYTFVRAYDKRTGYYKDYCIEYAPYLHFVGSYLWEMANKFIVEDACVWQQEDRGNLRPETSLDFRSLKVPEEVWKREHNWYRGYKNEI